MEYGVLITTSLKHLANTFLSARGSLPAITIPPIFTCLTPLERTPVCVGRTLPSIRSFPFRTVVVTRASPFFGVVYKLRIPLFGRVLRHVVGVTVSGLRTQHMFVLRHGRPFGRLLPLQQNLPVLYGIGRRRKEALLVN